MLLDSHPADKTPALVIDFDHAEKKDKSKDKDNKSDKQTVVCS